MKKIIYLLILMLLPYKGVTIAGNAESKNHNSQTGKGKSELMLSPAIIKNENLTGVRHFNSGGITLEDPQ